jgi:hypothetical protein
VAQKPSFCCFTMADRRGNEHIQHRWKMILLRSILTNITLNQVEIALELLHSLGPNSLTGRLQGAEHGAVVITIVEPAKKAKTLFDFTALVKPSRATIDGVRTAVGNTCLFEQLRLRNGSIQNGNCVSSCNFLGIPHRAYSLHQKVGFGFSISVSENLRISAIFPFGCHGSSYVDCLSK